MRVAGFILFIFPVIALAQNHSFPFGKVTYNDLNMITYSRDTSAVAVVLDEFGEAFINHELKLMFSHHFKLKILKKKALEEANYSIPLLKLGYGNDRLVEVRAASYNITENGIQQQEINKKDVFTDDKSEYVTLKKFAIPNVKVGSVIEIEYTVESPYIFNFKRWLFQGDYPKIRSEYWATIPGNYIYNISLKGYLALATNTSELVKECFAPQGLSRGDCSRFKFSMDTIPAFIEEDYMTARNNFESAIEFELSEIKHFNGAVDKITKDWKDVEAELRTNKSFGIQLKRGEDVMDSSIEALIAQETNPLAKAKKIYQFIQTRFTWNGDFSKYCDTGIKKAFENKTGNVGDINLSLIAALRYAKLDADPLILSTREHGIVTELYPVLSGFNYVVAKLTINDEVYLLDATDRLLPFGVLPFRCLNGNGRVIGDRTTSWYRVNATDKIKKVNFISVKFDKDGNLKGTLQNTYIGYAAINQRRKILSFNSVIEYTTDLERKLQISSLENFELTGLEDIEQPLVESMEITVGDVVGNSQAPILFNPFLINKWVENPFKSSERLYPVDFGMPLDERLTITIEFSEGMNVVQIPDNVALALPNNGGRYIISTQVLPGKISISSWLMINKAIYTSEEYHYLKELFNRVVQAQNTDVVFKRE